MNGSTTVFHILGIVSLLIGLVSLVIAVRSQRESKRVLLQNEELKGLLNMERQHFSWDDIGKACRELAGHLRNFNPDFIVTTPGSPMAVASLIIEELHQWMPVEIVYVTDQSVINSPETFDSDNYLMFQAARRKWHVPRRLIDLPSARIAVIDDLSFDSAYFDRLLELFERNGKVPRSNILTASLIASPVVLKSGSLDWHFFTVVNTSIYLPWGVDRSSISNAAK